MVRHVDLCWFLSVIDSPKYYREFYKNPLNTSTASVDFS